MSAVMYTSNNEQVQYGTFGDDEMNNEIYKEVTYDTLKEDFIKYFLVLDNILKQYLQLLKDNTHNYVEKCKEVEKKSLFYYIITVYIKKLSKEIENKITLQQQGINNIIQQQQQPEIKEIEQELNEILFQDDKLKSLFNNEYNGNIQNIISFTQRTHSLCKDVRNLSHQIGIVMLSITIKYMTVLFNKTITLLTKFKTLPELTPNNKLQNEITLFDFLLFLDKLEYFSQSLYNSIILPPNDCFNQQVTDPRWQKVKNIISRITFNNQNQIIQSITNLSESMSLSNVIVTNGFCTNYFALNIMYTLYIKYTHYRNPIQQLWDSRRNELKDTKENTIMKITSLYNNKMFKRMMLMSYPPIAFRKKLYLKREMRPITEEYLKLLINNINKGIDTKLEPLNNNNEPSYIVKPLYYEQIQKHEKVNYVSTRLIHSSIIHFVNEQPSYISLSYLKTWLGYNYTPPPNQTRDTLFIHIHGGGFVGTPTIAHEPYIRKWVNHWNIPLIGIDYSLSPQSQYPKALDDCWQGYNWIINHAEEIFNIKLKRIILSGDSAGGNLALGLVFLLIAHNLRRPDLLLLEYPCCDTGNANMSPSLLLGLQDGLLKMKFLEFVSHAYRGNYKEENDPFLNPEKANEYLLSKLPKTRYFIGSIDPLRDGTLRMLYKIANMNYNVDVKAYEFKDYVHAFYGIGDNIMRQPPTNVLLNEVDAFLQTEERHTNTNHH